jgi:hypothetical protein
MEALFGLVALPLYIAGYLAVGAVIVGGLITAFWCVLVGLGEIVSVGDLLFTGSTDFPPLSDLIPINFNSLASAHPVLLPALVAMTLIIAGFTIGVSALKAEAATAGR